MGFNFDTGHFAWLAVSNRRNPRAKDCNSSPAAKRQHMSLCPDERVAPANRDVSSH